MEKQCILAFVVLAVVLPTATLATEFVVGDEAGWTIKFDYEGWAKGKEFHVGDKLVFKYQVGSHNVYQVGEDEYKKCTIPSGGGLASGADTITLESEGPHYFLCGVGLHCEKGGQKLQVNVKRGNSQLAEAAKAPSHPQPAKGSPVASPSQSPAAGEASSEASSEASPPLAISDTSSDKGPAPAPSASNGLRSAGFELSLAIAVAVVVF